MLKTHTRAHTVCLIMAWILHKRWSCDQHALPTLTLWVVDWERWCFNSRTALDVEGTECCFPPCIITSFSCEASQTCRCVFSVCNVFVRNWSKLNLSGYVSWRSVCVWYSIGSMASRWWKHVWRTGLTVWISVESLRCIWTHGDTFRIGRRD